MSYTINYHRHVFAAWAAGRASHTAADFCHYSVEDAHDLLKAVGFGKTITKPGHLPRLQDLDDWHRKMRSSIIRRGNYLTFGDDGEWQCQFTHGIAAKLINVYVKSAFVCGPHYKHPRISGFHPPIDRLLLQALKQKDKNEERNEFWSESVRPGGLPWTQWDSADYQFAIDGIRQFLLEKHKTKELWKIERLWVGHQPKKRR